MISMRQKNCTLQEIGDEFGYTRGYIRQILKSLGVNHAKAPKPQRWPIPCFYHKMRAWLYLHGYRYCSRCQLWKCADECPAKARGCRECNTIRCLEYRHLYPEKANAYSRQWQHKNKDKMKQYSDAWWDRLPDERKEEIRKSRIAQTMKRYREDREYREKFLEYCRKRYYQKKAEKNNEASA
jgi:hypothetical protein